MSNKLAEFDLSETIITLLIYKILITKYDGIIKILCLIPSYKYLILYENWWFSIIYNILKVEKSVFYYIMNI